MTFFIPREMSGDHFVELFLDGPIVVVDHIWKQFRGIDWKINSQTSMIGPTSGQSQF